MTSFIIKSIQLALLVAVTRACLTVPKGQVTFDSEGNDSPGSRYYSRVPHVPTSWSGITIGRGYDMKYRSSSSAYADLTRSGIDKTFASKISKGAGLSGSKATKFIKDNKLEKTEITRQQQCNLFAITYAVEEKVTIRVVEKYTKATWSRLQSKIQQILVDLKYRGDLLLYSSSANQVALKKAVEKNDLKAFKSVISNRAYWPNVPRDRFQRRVNFL